MLDSVDVYTLQDGRYYVTNGVNMPPNHPHGYIFVNRILEDYAWVFYADPYNPDTTVPFNKQGAGTWLGWNMFVTNSDFDKYNLNYHARETIRSGTINDFIANKINGGYFGGDIIIAGDFIPSDSFKEYGWGLIHWKKSGSSIVFLTYFPDRATEIGYKSISPSESYDTGWIVK